MENQIFRSFFIYFGKIWESMREYGRVWECMGVYGSADATLCVGGWLAPRSPGRRRTPQNCCDSMCG